MCVLEGQTNRVKKSKRERERGVTISRPRNGDRVKVKVRHRVD